MEIQATSPAAMYPPPASAPSVESVDTSASQETVDIPVPDDGGNQIDLLA